MRSDLPLVITLSIILLSCTSVVQVICDETPSLVIVLHTPGEGSFWPSPEQNIKESPKVLKPTGVRQMYLLGKELRNRYAAKLGIESFDADKYFSYSYDDYENLQSSQSFLSGFYPVGSATNIDSAYNLARAVPPFNYTWDAAAAGYKGYEPLPKNYQIVPVHSNDTRREQWLHSFDEPVCPKIQRKKKTPTNTTYKQIVEKFSNTTTEIKKIWKLEETPRLDKLQDIMENMMYNYTKGVNPHEALKKRLRAFDSVIRLYLKFNSDYYNRIYITPLFREFTRFMESTAYNKTSQIKFIEYSASETTLDLILTVLNITSRKCMLENYPNETYPDNCPMAPGRASFLLFEMNKLTNGKYNVKFSYDDRLYPLPPSNGKNETDFEQFHKYLLNVTNGTDFNYTDMCGQDFEEDKYDPNDGIPAAATSLQIILLIILIVFGFFTAYFTCKNYRSL